jgi:hypothetical protein
VLLVCREALDDKLPDGRRASIDEPVVPRSLVVGDLLDGVKRRRELRVVLGTECVAHRAVDQEFVHKRSIEASRLIDERQGRR